MAVDPVGGTALGRFSAARPPAVVLGDLPLIRSVAMAGIPVVLVTPEPNDVALRSRHVATWRIVPGFDAATMDASAEALVRLGEELERAVGRVCPLFYNSDKNLEMLYRHRAAIERRFLVVFNDEDVAWALHDKAGFGELAQRTGVLAPRTLSSAGAIAERLDELREPLLVKPKRKNDWKAIQRDVFDGQGKARVFATRRELLEHAGLARHRDAVIVQEHIDGDVRDLVSFHGYADERGRLLAWYVGRKIRTSPCFAGESSFIELVRDDAVERVGRSVAEALTLRGPFKIDLIRDPRTGGYYTLEVNARWNLWNHLGAVHGVNLCEVAYDWLVDHRAPDGPPRYEPRFRWVNLYRDFQAFRELDARGALALGSWLGSVAGPRVVHETFAWDDPLPFVQWAGEFVREKFAPGARG